MNKGRMKFMKKIFGVFFTLLVTVSVCYTQNHKGLMASENAYAIGNKISGRIGDLQRNDRFYIYTNSYPFRVVDYVNTGGIFHQDAFALCEQSIGNITWTETYGNIYTSQSNYRELFKQLNAQTDNRDKEIMDVYIKQIDSYSGPALPDINDNIPANENPYFIGIPMLSMLFGHFGNYAQSIINNHDLESMY